MVWGLQGISGGAKTALELSMLSTQGPSYPSGVLLGPPGVLLAVLGRPLGVSWSLWRVSWVPLGFILAAPGGLLGPSGQPLRRYVKHSKKRVFYVVFSGGAKTAQLGYMEPLLGYIVPKLGYQGPFGTPCWVPKASATQRTSRKLSTPGSKTVYAPIHVISTT